MYTLIILYKVMLIWLSFCCTQNSARPVQANLKTVNPVLIAQSNDEAPLNHVITLDFRVDQEGSLLFYVGDYINSTAVIVMKRADDRLETVDYLGREGRGPGELFSVKNIQFLNNGNLFVYDDQLYRATIFDSETKGIRETITISDFPIGGYFPRQMFAAGSSDADYFTLNAQLFDDFSNPDRERTFRVMQVTPENTLAREPVLEKKADEALVIRDGSLMAVSPNRVFGRKSVFRFKKDLIYYGWTGTNKIEVYTDSGRHLETIELELPHVKVTEDDVTRGLEREALLLGEPESLIRNTYKSKVPGFWPWFEDFLIDEQNRFWVSGAAHFTDDVRPWYIFGRNGKLRHIVYLPVNFTILQIKAGYMAGELIDYDNLSIRLQLYKIE